MTPKALSPWPPRVWRYLNRQTGNEMFTSGPRPEEYWYATGHIPALMSETEYVSLDEHEFALQELEIKIRSDVFLEAARAAEKMFLGFARPWEYSGDVAEALLAISRGDGQEQSDES